MKLLRILLLCLMKNKNLFTLSKFYLYGVSNIQKKEKNMINKINNISFQSKFHINGYSKHTPKAKPFDEYYFMPQLKEKKNPIKNFFKNMIQTAKDIMDASKTEFKEETKNGAKIVY